MTSEPVGQPASRIWTVRRLLGAVTRRILTRGESRVYCMPATRAAALTGGEELARDTVEHFGHYAPDNRWDRSVSDQRAEVVARLQDGAHCYTLLDGSRLVHHSYMTAPSSSIDLDYRLGEFRLPPGSAKLWDDNTHHAARGRGLHQLSLRRRARDAGLTPGISWIYICVRADNGPSRHNIEKVGFELVHAVQVTRVLGVRFRRVRTPTGPLDA